LSKPNEIEVTMRGQRFTVYWIRHGLTYQNLCREYQGSAFDYDILPESRALIEQRRERGAVPDVATVWASPLLRARRTAELYFPNHAIECVPDIRERGFGVWDGKTHDELVGDPLYRQFRETFGDATPSGGETHRAFMARLRRALERLNRMMLETPEAFPLAMVFHGGPILHLTDLLLPPDHACHRFYVLGAGGLRLEMTPSPLTVEAAEPIFTDDVPVEMTPFYTEFERPPYEQRHGDR
jgi:alpha-ribazole phosphatase